jgi:hypothetical protein
MASAEQTYHALLEKMRASARKEDMEGLSRYGVQPRVIPPELPGVTKALKGQKK